MGKKKSLIVVNMPSATGEILIDPNESILNITNGSENVQELIKQHKSQEILFPHFENKLVPYKAKIPEEKDLNIIAVSKNPTVDTDS